MTWREHLANDLELIWDGVSGARRTICAMLFGRRIGKTGSVVEWQGMMWNMEPRENTSVRLARLMRDVEARRQSEEQ